jgi:hypothetical protein
VGHPAHETEADAMTNTPPKRRFWQIHLSTAIIAMFVSSALVALNAIPTEYDDAAELHRAQIALQQAKMEPEYIPAEMKRYGYGWPQPWLYVRTAREAIHEPYLSEWWRGEPLAKDVVSMLGIVLLVIIASELLIRRRSKP